MEPGAWQLYEELLNEKTPTVRVFALFRGGRTLESARAAFPELQQHPKPPQSLGDGMLFAGGVKLFMDGSGGGRTAWVYEPWHKDGKYDGTNTRYPNIEPRLHHDMVQLLHDASYHVNTHAVCER